MHGPPPPNHLPNIPPMEHRPRSPPSLHSNPIQSSRLLVIETDPGSRALLQTPLRTGNVSCLYCGRCWVCMAYCENGCVFWGYGAEVECSGDLQGFSITYFMVMLTAYAIVVFDKLRACIKMCACDCYGLR